MRIRKVDAAGDMIFGGSQASFFRDVPDAPALVVSNRLHLWSGQWFLDLTKGIDYQRRVLGKRTESTRDPVIRAEILDSQGVSGIAEYSSTLNRDTRTFDVVATIDTVYGQATLRETI
ncbi:hypothetical protein [Methylobacterium sp. WL19]|uniref:hypothetical protein n=1 Tax=Methylobacterium sp. WL19 TaxID=2603896 RepID=UPI0011C90506|nr:hypothetical protein [Methylobacterium sp. WL19]TXN33893.1 hypothetical protein FV220_00120 [Methylobacterium sp. WL19]